MKRNNIAKYLVIVVSFAVLFVAGPVYAADNTAALKKEIQQLQRRIKELEQQIASPMAQPEPQLSNRDILQEMDHMRRQMHRLFMNSAARDWEQQMGPDLGMESFFSPQIDVQQNADAYMIKMDIPDMEKEKINLEVRDNMLLVSGERNKVTEDNNNGRFFRQERSYGYFSRAIPLPENVKTDAISAEYKRGVLIVTIPKKAVPDNKPAAQKIRVL